MTMNFSIKELNISNDHPELVAKTISIDIADNLMRLITELLQPIRNAWGDGIRVTSGYRPAALNKAAGGVSTSAHLYGMAADIVPTNGKQAAFETCIYQLAKSGKIKYDQIIIEKSGATRWVHVAILHPGDKKQRMQLFKMNI